MVAVRMVSRGRRRTAAHGRRLRHLHLDPAVLRPGGRPLRPRPAARRDRERSSCRASRCCCGSRASWRRSATTSSARRPGDWTEEDALVAQALQQRDTADLLVDEPAELRGPRERGDLRPGPLRRRRVRRDSRPAPSRRRSSSASPVCSTPAQVSDLLRSRGKGPRHAQLRGGDGRRAGAAASELNECVRAYARQSGSRQARCTPSCAGAADLRSRRPVERSCARGSSGSVPGRWDAARGRSGDDWQNGAPARGRPAPSGGLIVRRSLIAVVPAVALLLAACGSTASSSSSAPAGTSSASASAECSPTSMQTLTPGKFTVATGSPAFPPWFIDDKPENGKGFESAVAYAVAQEARLRRRGRRTWIRAHLRQRDRAGAEEVRLRHPRVLDHRRAQEGRRLLQRLLRPSPRRSSPSRAARSTKATTIADLKDAKLGAQWAPQSFDAIDTRDQAVQAPHVYNTTTTPSQALKAKQIDGLVVDLPTAFYVTAAQLKDGAIVGQFPNTGGDPEQFGLLLDKGSPLTTCVTQAVDALRTDGTLAKLAAQWLAQTGGRARPAVTSAAEGRRPAVGPGSGGTPSQRELARRARPAPPVAGAASRSRHVSSVVVIGAARRRRRQTRRAGRRAGDVLRRLSYGPGRAARACSTAFG